MSKAKTGAKVAAKSTTKVAKSATKKVAKSTTKVAKSATKKVAKSATKSGAKKSAAKKSAAKKLAKSPAKKARKSGAKDLAARATAASARLVAWLQAHAQLEPLPAGASEKLLKRFETALGRELPADLAAWWRAHDGGVPIFEYTGLGVAEALRVRAGLEKLRKQGTFADHEIFEQSVPRFAAVKWHAGWVPLAQDGCGNLYLIDTAPGPAGTFGQVLRWEVRGGAFAGGTIGLAGLLERYADALESGKFVYDPDSGIFDGPFLNMLADE